MFAAENGHDEAVELFLDKGENLEARNDVGCTALSEWAVRAYWGNPKLLMLRGGACSADRTPTSLRVPMRDPRALPFPSLNP